LTLASGIADESTRLSRSDSPWCVLWPRATVLATRSIAKSSKAARFPNYGDIAGFDFANSEVNEALVRQLHRCEFLEDAHNAVLVGGPEPES
jgi:IstB-like ATP binding protein